MVFSVSDTGPGIAPDRLNKIFSHFWQGDPRDRRGIGLGLAISKGIVEAHGGRIWLESVVGSGTTFFFALPTSPEGADTAGGPIVASPWPHVAAASPGG